MQTRSQYEQIHAQAVQAIRLQRAHVIAADARSRNKPACQCPACWQADRLPGLQQMLERRAK